jgi:NAD(P)-dependent dehydrogenase (short-subunit alcohol dehydrogenase family)
VSRVRVDAAARFVITGAGSGIGRATALRCARAGASVVAVDIDPSAAEETAARCRAAGAGAADARVCDVADAPAVQALADAVEAGLGPVDVLVNNAGVGLGGPFLDASIADWDWLRSINLDGVAYGCRAFGAAMVERRRGHVVNLASGAAYIHTRHMAAYCATKSAVLALSRCLRADWADSGVGVSAICPGVINTGIHTRARMYGPLSGQSERIARAFRFGHSPDLVAKAIVRAVERNQAVVPVGFESEVLYRLLPFVPAPIEGLLARASLG